ncbi:hypothetical protein FHQ13_020675 [Bacillus cereus]|uniref:hypothetical protein n=1 Tax=Bacillus cereus TaxID=1396 RepID=UPI00111E4B30|nr:hypothetical protein [Bacillus cereus]UDV99643.1 hypothetical protein FHQ13_020675 [Bacillus cereus]
MQNKRELQKQIEACKQEIIEYQNCLEKLKDEWTNPSVTISQQKMNKHLISRCKQYIKASQRKLDVSNHELHYPSKPSTNLYDSLWESVLNGEKIKVGRLV